MKNKTILYPIALVQLMQGFGDLLCLLAIFLNIPLFGKKNRDGKIQCIRPQVAFDFMTSKEKLGQINRFR